MWHFHPHVRVSGFIPALYFIGERRAVGVEETQISTVVLGAGVIDVAAVEYDENRIVRQGLCTHERVTGKRQLLTVGPGRVPPIDCERIVLVDAVAVIDRDWCCACDHALRGAELGRVIAGVSRRGCDRVADGQSTDGERSTEIAAGIGRQVTEERLTLAVSRTENLHPRVGERTLPRRATDVAADRQ